MDIPRTYIIFARYNIPRINIELYWAGGLAWAIGTVPMSYFKATNLAGLKLHGLKKLL